MHIEGASGSFRHLPDLSKVPQLEDGSFDFGNGVIGPSEADREFFNSRREQSPNLSVSLREVKQSRFESPTFKIPKALERLFGRAMLVGGIGLVVACSAVTQGSDVPESSSNQVSVVKGGQSVIEAFSPEERKMATLNEARAFLKETYNIEIPEEPAEKFRVDTQLLNYEDIANDGYNDKLTLEEALVVVEVLSKISLPKDTPLLIIPYRFLGQDKVPGGTYIGRNWPIDRGSLTEDSSRQGTFASEKAAFELKLPYNYSLKDTLPPRGDNLPGLIGISHNSIHLNTEEDVPWTTFEERLKQSIVHETGHFLLDVVTLKLTNNNPEEYYQKQTFSIFNWTTNDSDHPLLRAFAKVNGWKLVPSSEYTAQYSEEWGRTLKEREEREGVTIRNWMRDQEIWGDIHDRKNHLTIYASYGPIQEAFCEYWMAYNLYPELLTDSEFIFFRNIEKGLQENPEFITLIVQKPEVLFEGTGIEEARTKSIVLSTN